MAEDRKARLAALAARAKRSNPTNPEEEEEERKESEKQEQSDYSKRELKFRNYSPKTLSTKRQKVNNLDESKQEVEKEDEDFGKSSLENAIRQVNQLKKNTSVINNNIHSGGRKENWDLKRDIETKLSRLERRTQRAIISLLKERLQKEAEEQSSNPNNLD